jgi:toxin FitB
LFGDGQPTQPRHDAGPSSPLVVLPYDQHVATRWGEVQAYAQLRGHPRPVNDSWIAACCLVRELPLATFNVKDYADFVEHEGLELVH